jgi:hypothetical protein
MKTQLSKPTCSKARYTDQYKQEALELWRVRERRKEKGVSLGLPRFDGEPQRGRISAFNISRGSRSGIASSEAPAARRRGRISAFNNSLDALAR